MKRLLLLVMLMTSMALVGAGTSSAALTRSCDGDVDSFIRSLRVLDSRLNVGLTYPQYRDRLGDISVSYDDAVSVIEQGDVDGRCLTVAIRGEKAFNLYIKAQNVWNRCIQNIGCSTDSIEPQLQRIWAKASKRVAQAWRNLQ